MAVISALYRDLNTQVMKIKILGKQDTQAYELAHETVAKLGHSFCVNGCDADLAIAPLLTEKLSYDEISAPLRGTLIFHPSPLPYGRGAASIKWAYRRREPITAATWFWANDGKMDSGDICEMEIVKIDYNLSPREFYETHVLPASVRTLERALRAIAEGYRRRVPQVEEYSSFDFKT